MQKNKYNFGDLVKIMEKLRAPDGCPWDREQTHESLKKYMIEETYEVIEAIDGGESAKIADELGDLLLQIVFHAQIGRERGEFDINDVTQAICEKMIRRHPHVFGSTSVNNSEEVLTAWDEIKKEEKGEKSVTDTLNSVSRYLPALMRAQKVQHKASKVGFDWEDVWGAMDKIEEETKELCEAVKKGEGFEEEIGDLLFAVVNAARFLGVNPEQALTNTTGKFINRFSYIEENAQKYGKSLDKLTIKEMDDLWNEAKFKKILR